MRDDFAVNVMSGVELSKKVYPEVVPVIGNMFYKGLNSLTAAPKIGKGWMVQQMIHGIITGGKFLGQDCSKGKCLIVPMEEDLDMIQSRMRTAENISEDVFVIEDTHAILKECDSREEFVECIADIAKKLECIFVVIDPIVTVTNLPSPNDNDGNAYQKERAIYEAIHKSFASRDIAMLAVHHTNKMGAYSGSTALPSVGNGHLVIYGTQAKGQLNVQCRRAPDDISCDVKAVRGDKGLEWIAAGIDIDPDMYAILDVIKEEGSISTDDLVGKGAIKCKVTIVRAHVRQMIEKGVINKVQDGKYRKLVLPEGMNRDIAKTMLNAD